MSLGLGSVVASTLEAAPWLMTVGRQKAIIFAAVGVLLAFNYWLAVVRPKRLDCAPGDVCHIDSPSSRFNRAMFWTSLSIYVIAVTLTYGAQWWILRS
ncbi:MAG TPA: hypothetical protein VM096_09615 [Vicinamibacterales bacterium]|nr:hypothetical protein [Vicinamibacterales bacterium]